jgi:hypothetical protein
LRFPEWPSPPIICEIHSFSRMLITRPARQRCPKWASLIHVKWHVRQCKLSLSRLSLFPKRSRLRCRPLCLYSEAIRLAHARCVIHGGTSLICCLGGAQFHSPCLPPSVDHHDDDAVLISSSGTLHMARTSLSTQTGTASREPFVSCMTLHSMTCALHA